MKRDEFNNNDIVIDAVVEYIYQKWLVERVLLVIYTDREFHCITLMYKNNNSTNLVSALLEW